MGRDSLARSRAVAGVGYTGRIPEDVWVVLERAWSEPIYASGNFARTQAIAVAFAASMGWISTIAPSGREYRRTWHITAEGLVAIRSNT